LADWLRGRCRSGPFTTRGLTAELAARGIKTDRRAVWVFVRAEDLSLKKKRSAGRAGQARRRPQAAAMEDPSTSHRPGTPRLHR
jgi:transposase